MSPLRRRRGAPASPDVNVIDVDLPEAWVTAKPMAVACRTRGEVECVQVFLADCTIVAVYAYPDGAQRLARCSAMTKYAIEERHAGRPPIDDVSRSQWRELLAELGEFREHMQASQ